MLTVDFRFQARQSTLTRGSTQQSTSGRDGRPNSRLWFMTVDLTIDFFPTVDSRLQGLNDGSKPNM
eukprot:832381-Prorocentrum_minimum.AAC.4